MDEIEAEMREVEREYNAGMISEAEYERTMRALEREWEHEEALSGYDDDF